jgi:hypothetical protein
VQVASEPKARKARVAEAVESGVEGAMRFLQRFAATALRVNFWPRQGIRRLLADRRRDVPTYVLPLTFLAIGIFLLSLLGQTAGVLVLDWIWFADDIGQKVTEALRKEVSLASVVVQAIPGMAAVILLSSGFGWLARPWPLTRRIGLVTYAYAFGAQSTLLFFVVFGAVGADALTSSYVGGRRSDAAGYVMAIIVGAGLLSAFVGPIWFALASLRLRSEPQRPRSVRAALAKAWLVLSLLLGHVLVLYGARAPSEVIAAAKGPSTPTVDVDTVQFATTKDRLLIRAVVLVENRTDPLNWRTKSLRLALQVPDRSPSFACRKDWLSLQVDAVTDSHGYPVPIAQIEPNRTGWVIVNASAEMTPQIADLLKQTREWAIRVSLSTAVTTLEQPCASTTLEEKPQLTGGRTI